MASGIRFAKYWVDDAHVHETGNDASKSRTTDQKTPSADDIVETIEHVLRRLSKDLAKIHKNYKSSKSNAPAADKKGQTSSQISGPSKRALAGVETAGPSPTPDEIATRVEESFVKAFTDIKNTLGTSGGVETKDVRNKGKGKK